MERRPAINGYVRQNCRWEIGDIRTIQPHPNMRIETLSQAYLYVI